MTRHSLCCAMLLLIAGCYSNLDSHYGVRSGVIGGSSVNGTAVLGKMFAQEGHSVSSWSRLSPRLQRADTIVWVPNEFDPPSEEVCEWLDDWLYEEEGRTLVYVERDFDAAPNYWTKITPLAPASQKKEVGARLGPRSGRRECRACRLAQDRRLRMVRRRSNRPGTQSNEPGGPVERGNRCQQGRVGDQFAS